jgi:hypothetical protein
MRVAALVEFGHPQVFDLAELGTQCLGKVRDFLGCLFPSVLRGRKELGVDSQREESGWFGRSGPHRKLGYLAT